MTHVHQLRAKRPTENQARSALAHGLSQGSYEKAQAVLRLPLFEVAIDGMAGMHEACARANRRRAA